MKTQYKVLTLTLTIAGAVAGVLIVRAFFLDWTQIWGWNMFWDGKMMNSDDLNTIFRSATFLKCVAGFIVGGVVGAYIGVGIALSKKYPPASGGSQ